MSDEAARLADFVERKADKEVPHRIRKFVAQKGWSADDIKDQFGQETTIFDLAICKHYLDTCRCEREFMWSRTQEGQKTEVPVSTPVVCQAHLEHTGDIQKLHSILVAESRHRQNVRREVLHALPAKFKKEVPGGDYEFLQEPVLAYDDDRELVVTLPGVPEDDVVTPELVRRHLDSKFVTRRVKVPAAKR